MTLRILSGAVKVCALCLILLSTSLKISAAATGSLISGSQTVCDGANAIIEIKLTGDAPFTITLSKSAYAGQTTLTLPVTAAELSSDGIYRYMYVPTVGGSNYFTLTSVRDINGPGSIQGLYNRMYVNTTVPSASIYYAAVLGPVCSGDNVLNLSGNSYSCNGTPPQWQYSMDGQTTYQDIPGATQNNPDLKNFFYNYTSANVTVFLRIKMTGYNNRVYYSNVISFTLAPAVKTGLATLSNSTICAEQPFTLSITGHTGEVTWQVSSDDKTYFEIGKGSTLTTSFPYGGNAVNYFRAKITGSTSCMNAAQYSNVITAVAYDKPFKPTIYFTDAGQATGKTLCSGQSTIMQSYGAPRGVYQWMSSTDGNTYTPIPGANEYILNIGQQINTTNHVIRTYYRLDVIGGSCFTASSDPLMVNVLPVPNGGTVTATRTSLCQGETSTITVNGNSDGAINWQESYNGTNFYDISNKGASITVPHTSLLVGYATTIHYRVKMGDYNSCAGLAFSPSIAITSQALITPSVIPAAKTSQTICSGNAVSLDMQWNGGSIQWLSSTDNITFTPIAGETGNTFNTGTLTNTGSAPVNYYYRIQTNSGGCTQELSNVATVTVNPVAQLGTVSINTAQVCPGATLTLSLTSSNSTVIWQESLNGTSFYNISAATTGNTFTYTPQNIMISGTRYYRASSGGSGSCGSTVYSNIVSATVHPSIQASTLTIATQEDICSGQTVSLSLSNGGGSIQWMTSTDGITFSAVSNPVNSTQYTTPVLTNTDAATVDYYYQAIASTGTCQSFTSNTVVIHVHSNTTVGTVTADALSLCNGEGTTLHLTGYNGATLTWQRGTPTGNYIDLTTGSSILDYPTGALNQFTMGSTLLFRAKITNTMCGTTLYSNAVTVNLLPGASITELNNGQAASLEMCSGNTASLSLKTYGDMPLQGQLQWYENINGTITALPSANTLQYTTAALINTGTTAQTHIYYAEVTQGSCPPLKSPEITIQVYPQPVAGTISAISNSICTNATANLTLNNYVGTQIQWQRQISLSSYTNMPGGTTPTVNTGNLQLGGVFRVIVSTNATGCNAATTALFTISITPVPTAPATPTGPSSICPGTSTTDYSITAVAHATSYTWSITPAAAGTISGTDITAQVTWNPAYRGTAGIKVIAVNGCGTSAPSSSFTVTCNDAPAISLTDVATDYCIDAPAGLIVGTPGGGTFSGPGVEFAPFFGKARFAPGIAGAGTHTLSYTYTDATTGCTSTATATTMVHSFVSFGTPIVTNATCEGQTQVYEMPLTGNINSVQWIRSDPTLGWVQVSNDSRHTIATVTGKTTLNIITDYSLNGTQYVVGITGFCGGGNSYSGALTLTVNPNTAITIQPSDLSVCEDANGTNSSLVVRGTTPISYQWQDNATGNFADIAQTNSTLSISSATQAMNGRRYRCVITGACGPVVTTDEIETIVNTKPVINPITAITVCQGGSVTLTATGNAVSYSWNNSVNNGVAFVPAQTATYTVTGTDANGCTNTAEAEVIVNALPVVSMSALASSYCAGGPALILAGVPSGGVFTGPGVSGNTYTPTTVGNNTVQYTYTNANGCTNSSSRSTTVIAKPFSPFACANPQGWCSAGQVEICIFNSDFSAPNWKLYDNNMNLLSGYGLTTPSVSANTTFYLSSSTTQGCESNKTAIPVYIGGLATQDINACGQPTVNLFNGTPGFGLGTVRFQTTPLPNKPEITNPETYPVSGDVTVYAAITYFKSNGTVSCVSFSPVNIYTSACRSAADEVSADKMVVFPNPASDELTIQLSRNCETVTVSIMNLQGEVIYSESHTTVDGKIELTTSALPAGLYALTVQCATEVYQTKVSIVR